MLTDAVYRIEFIEFIDTITAQTAAVQRTRVAHQGLVLSPERVQKTSDTTSG